MRRRRVCLTNDELDRMVEHVTEQVLASIEHAERLEELRVEVRQLKRVLRNRKNPQPQTKADGAR